MASTNSSYDAGGGITTRSTRTQLTLPDIPDFWGDLALTKKQLVPRADQQAAALRRPNGFTPSAAPAERNAAQNRFQEEYVPTFATQLGLGPQSAGVAYQNWVPGMTFSPTNAPIATGYARR